MTIDQSAVARVTGVETTFEDLRDGSILLLPQRIAVFAQGSTISSFALDKVQVTSSGEVGALYGFGSPVHLAARELFPDNGDGVGTVPVTIYPLADSGSGVVATGDVAPTGTQTEAAAYRARVNGILGSEFTIPVGAIDVSAVCAQIGDSVNAILHMPVTVVQEYGTVTGTPDGGNAGDGTVTVLSVTGSPIPGNYLLTCNTAVSEGGVFTFTDPNGTVISTTVTMTPASGGTTVIGLAGLQFTITDGAADFEVADFFVIAAPSTAVNLPAKWKGESGNDVVVDIVGDTTLGTTFSITAHAAGAVNPTLDDALLLVGNTWETLGLNGLNGEDTTALNTLQTFGDGRWGELVRKPMVFVRGNTDAVVGTATTIPAARTTDKINAQLVAPGSVNLPIVVAARQLARIAKLANNNPPHDYGSQRATGLLPGAENVQWDYADRDVAVKAGSSTVEIKDGVVNISDVVTHYAPVAEPVPGYRFVVDIVKLQNIIFNLDLIFATAEWDGAPLLADGDPTTNATAKKPYMAKAAVNAMLDSLGLAAIISNPAAAKKVTTANINQNNPKRLDVTVTVQLSGNTNIKGIALGFGFLFGSAAIVA